MKRITLGGKLVYAAAYDALTMILEIRFAQTGEVILFHDVEEDVWYSLKRARSADRYFQENICGNYVEQKIPKKRSC